MTDIWNEWNDARHEWSEGEAKQEFVVNKMERVVNEAVARISELEAQVKANAAIVELAIAEFEADKEWYSELSPTPGAQAAWKRAHYDLHRAISGVLAKRKE